jgi:hypothetical protein
MNLNNRIRSRIPFLRALIRPSRFPHPPLWSSTVDLAEVIKEPRISELKEIFDKFGSDKGSVHDYHIPYSWILDQLPSNGVILEIGIGTNNPSLPSTMGLKGKPGASLRAWRETQKFTEVIGADIDRDCLFHEEKISTFFVDQLDVNELIQLREELKATKPQDFNLIVDDGLHNYLANKNTFEILFPILNRHGYYVIEDIRPEFILPLLSFLGEMTSIDISLWSNPAKGNDNTLIIIKKN